MKSDKQVVDQRTFIYLRLKHSIGLGMPDNISSPVLEVGNTPTSLVIAHHNKTMTLSQILAMAEQLSARKERISAITWNCQTQLTTPTVFKTCKDTFQRGSSEFRRSHGTVKPRLIIPSVFSSLAPTVSRWTETFTVWRSSAFDMNQEGPMVSRHSQGNLQ